MMAEMMRTVMKLAATVVTFFASFACVIGLGRSEKALGRLRWLVTRPLGSYVVNANDRAIQQ